MIVRFVMSKCINVWVVLCVENSWKLACAVESVSVRLLLVVEKHVSVRVVVLAILEHVTDFFPFVNCRTIWLLDEKYDC